ncbi:MAG: UDP-N-acetylglucosamine 1-carboxyvinyltransferase, partial [Tetragenococcus koreensis]|nr:UDP-N-acetylglucosamine 1-carboxyvinyltransferase [Tetragenococcus koreensis]
NRFQHLEEMRKMNAHMKIDGNVAIMQGNDALQGALVYATDLRAAAALILAGLDAEGITRVRNLKYLDRGYYHFHEKLQKLGAQVERISDSTEKEVKEEVHV